MIRMRIGYRLLACSQAAYQMRLDMKRRTLVDSNFYGFYNMGWVSEVKVGMLGIVIATNFAI